MLRAIGSLIFIWGIVQIFNTAATSFETAVISVFELITTSSEITIEQLQRKAP